MSMARVAVAAAALTSLACLSSCKKRGLTQYSGELKLERILSDGMVEKQEFDGLSINEKAKLIELLGGDFLSFNDNEPILLNEKQMHLTEESINRLQQVQERQSSQLVNEEKSKKFAIPGIVALLGLTVTSPIIAARKSGIIAGAVVLAASVFSLAKSRILHNKAENANSGICNILSNSYSDFYVNDNIDIMPVLIHPESAKASDDIISKLTELEDSSK